MDDIKFNKQQLRELKWFCENVTGLRQEYYALWDDTQKFKRKFERLLKTCELIEKYLTKEPSNE